jgi:hypothetical protein
MTRAMAALVSMAACHVGSRERAVDSFLTLAQVNVPWFAGWGTLALINAGLAQGKNRNGLLWFLLSLVLGPVATLVLVLMPKVRSRLF